MASVSDKPDVYCYTHPLRVRGLRRASDANAPRVASGGRARRLDRSPTQRARVPLVVDRPGAPRDAPRGERMHLTWFVLWACAKGPETSAPEPTETSATVTVVVDGAKDFDGAPQRGRNPPAPARTCRVRSRRRTGRRATTPRRRGPHLCRTPASGPTQARRPHGTTVRRGAQGRHRVGARPRHVHADARRARLCAAPTPEVRAVATGS